MCHKTCIFFFFPIINKYLCMAKRSLLSRCPMYHQKLREEFANGHWNFNKSYGKNFLLYVTFQYNFLYNAHQPDQLCSITWHHSVTSTVNTVRISNDGVMNLFSVLYSTHEIHMLRNIKILGHICPRQQLILLCLLLDCAVTHTVQDVQVSAKLCQSWITFGLQKLNDVHLI